MNVPQTRLLLGFQLAASLGTRPHLIDIHTILLFYFQMINVMQIL
jgi:hypothetical protein